MVRGSTVPTATPVQWYPGLCSPQAPSAGPPSLGSAAEQPPSLTYFLTLSLQFLNPGSLCLERRV